VKPQYDPPSLPGLNLVTNVHWCDLCLDGAGGECHTPGCIFYLSTAPDIPLRKNIIERGGIIFREIEPYDTGAPYIR